MRSETSSDGNMEGRIRCVSLIHDHDSPALERKHNRHLRHKECDLKENSLVSKRKGIQFENVNI